MYRSSRSNRRVHRWLEDLPTTPEPPSPDTMSNPTVYVLTDDGHRSPSRRHSSRRSGHSSRHHRSSSVNTHSRPRRQTLHRLRTSSLVNLPQSTSPYKRYPSPDSTVSPSDSASQVGKSTYRGLQNTGHTHMVYAPSPVYPTSPVGSMSGTTVYAGSQWLQQPQSLTYSSGQPVYYVYSQPQVYTQPQTYLQPQTAFGWSGNGDIADPPKPSESEEKKPSFLKRWFSKNKREEKNDDDRGSNPTGATAVYDKGYYRTY